MQWRTTYLPPGDPGIRQTVREMQRIVRREQVDPLVRRYSTRLAGGCAPNDRLCIARRLWTWVKATMRYVPDPVGVEAFTTPVEHLREFGRAGAMYGDCDDAVGLLSAMLQSVGVPARFAVASFRPDGKFHHVWTEALVGPGQWVELDTFRAERFDSTPTRVQYFPV